MAENLLKRGNTWYVRVMVQGKRHCQSLKTSDRREAEKKAKLLVKEMMEERWENVFAVAPARKLATIGEVCDTYRNARELQSSDNSRRDQANYLLRVVRLGLPTSTPGSQPVTCLTKDLVFRFQKAMLGKYGSGPMDQNRASVTANSALRQARAVFSNRALERGTYRDLELGGTIKEFMKAEELKELPNDNYVPPSGDEISQILAAVDVVKTKNPHVWAIFWLSLNTGMRRRETQHARWSWLTDSALNIPCNETFIPKGKRERQVPVVANVRAELLKVAQANNWPTGPDDYLLPLKARERNHKPQQNPIETKRQWAMEALYREFGTWMKANGWIRRQKAHELRKLFATAVGAMADAFAAQTVLGHQKIQTTMRYVARPKVAPVDASKFWAALSPAKGPTLT